MKKATTTLIFIILTLTKSYGQRALIKVDRLFYDNSYEKFDSIQFFFNNVNFLATDTTLKTITLNKQFDHCKVIIEKDTLIFLTKFKPNEEYTIRPGCCCAAFTLEPKNNPKRGTIIFKNETKKDLGLVIAEANIDTVKINQTKKTFASESAMCLFKPCSILLTETTFFSNKYNYESDDRNYDELWKERSTYILAETWFHFLHGEKIRIKYNEKTKKLDLKLTGYMTEKEYVERLK